MLNQVVSNALTRPAARCAQGPATADRGPPARGTGKEPDQLGGGHPHSRGGQDACGETVQGAAAVSSRVVPSRPGPPGPRSLDPPPPPPRPEDGAARKRSGLRVLLAGWYTSPAHVGPRSATPVARSAEKSSPRHAVLVVGPRPGHDEAVAIVDPRMERVCPTTDGRRDWWWRSLPGARAVSLKGGRDSKFRHWRVFHLDASWPVRLTALAGVGGLLHGQPSAAARPARAQTRRAPPKQRSRV